MVDSIKSIHWLCGECGMDYDHKFKSDECCKEISEDRK